MKFTLPESLWGQNPSTDGLVSATVPTQCANPSEWVDTTAGCIAQLEPVTEATASAEMLEPGKLLEALWRSRDLFHQIGISGSVFQNVAVANVNEALVRSMKASKAGQEAYFAIAEYSTPDSRKASNAAGAWGFWVDVDVGDEKAAAGKGYNSFEDAKLALLTFCKQSGLPEPTHIVASGGGLHAYWVLDGFVDRELWIEFARKIKALTHEFGILADDCRTADIASVLRVPGTLNHKYDPPRAVTLVHAAPAFIKRAEMLTAIDTADRKLPKPVQTTIKPSRGHAAKQANVQADDLLFGPPDVKRLASALAEMDPDCSDSEWKFGFIAPLARAASAYPEIADELKQLAIAFSSGELRGIPSKKWVTPGNTNKLTGQQVFEGQWQRFLNEPPSNESRTGLGTIFHNAEQAGWIDPAKLFASIAPAEDSPVEDAESDSKAPAATPMPTPTAALAAVPGKAIATATQKAATNGKKQAGSSALLLDLQAQYALLNMAGKVCVLDRECMNTSASDGAAKKLVLSSRIDGALLMARRARALYPDVAAKEAIQEFFVSPGTTCYSGIEFNPAGTSPNYLNLWVGPTVTPTPGQWPLIKEFLLNVICSGNQSQFDYLIRLIAHALQRPWDKPGILVILIGGQGIGKGTLGRILRKIWSATYLQVNRVAAITGEFNSALERAFIVVMDEALFAGDHRASDALKSLVTEEVIHINEKHQPARQITSYHRFFIFTNADHVKSTDRDDRRDFTLRVSESRKGDHAYWAALDQEIQGAVVAAMVHDLLAMDLTAFNVRVKPSTQELVEQKLHSLGGIPRWWYDVLYSAELNSESGWPDFISTECIIKGVVELSGKKLHRNPSAMDVMQAMSKLCPSAKKGQKQEMSSRQRGLHIPTLEVARSEFEVYIGGMVQWDEVQDDDDTEQADDDQPESIF